MPYYPESYFTSYYFPVELFGGSTTGEPAPTVEGAPYLAPTYFSKYYFAPTYWGSISEHYVFDDFFGAIRKRILDEVPTLTNFFFQYPPPKPVKPYGIYSLINSIPEQNTGKDFLDIENVQFTIVCDTAKIALEVGMCVRNAISPHSRKMIPSFKTGYLIGINIGRYVITDRASPSQKYGWNASMIFDSTFMIGRSSP